MRPIGSTVLVLVLSACGGSPPLEGTVRSDSAGIEIISAKAAAAATLSFGPAQAEELGGPADAMLTIPMDVVPYRGGFAVSDAIQRAVVILRRDGSAIRIGRDGDGPGEFRRPIHLATGHDTLFVHDPSLARITTFVDGEPFGVWSLPKEWFDADFAGRLPDGTFVLGRDETVAAPPASGVSRHRYTLASVTLGPSGAVVDTLMIVPGRESLTVEDGEGGTLTMAAPYGRKAVATVWREHIVVGLTDRHELRIYDATGELKRLIRLSGVREPMTRKLRQAAAESLRNGFMQRSRTPSGTTADIADRMLDRMVWPDSVPAFASVWADSAGNLWIGRVRTDENREARWDVFDHEGTYIGPVDGLRRTSPMYVDGDRALMVSYDENDVPRLRMHALLREK